MGDLNGVQGRRWVCFGRGVFVSMLLLGCRLESGINGLSIGLTACWYSQGFGEDLRLFVNTV